MTNWRKPQTGTEPLEPTTFTFEQTQEIAAHIYSGAMEIDLSGMSQEGARRNELAPLSALAWWMLSVGDQDLALTLPTERATVRVLARSGLLFAAIRVGATLRQDGEVVTLEDALLEDGHHPRLPNTNWLVYGEPRSPAPIRAITDLEDPRRRPPAPVPNSGGRRYTWVDGLRAARSLDGREAAQFNSDLDQMIYETVSNVQRWSQAERALTVVSVTRGGSDSRDRVHIVTLDNGQGISNGVRFKRSAQRVDPDWHPEVESARREEPELTAVEDLDGALLYLLVHRAFGSRAIRSASEGHGLHAAGVIARRRGPLHLLSADPQAADPRAVHLQADRAPDGPSLRLHDRLELPGASGTMAHLGMWVDSLDHGGAAPDSAPQAQMV